MSLKYDFSGWATRNDLLCSDGRTIRKDAFAHCDGKTVPLVWNHQYSEPNNVLGHALLENRSDGVYAYCTFNETESGRAAKLLVRHGDVEALSIYANGLKQQNNDVTHGDIREVSLVIAGANPGAFIDFVDMAHNENGEGGQEVIIGTGENICLYHADNEENKPEEDNKPDNVPDNETVGDVINTLTEKQMLAVCSVIKDMLGSNETEKKNSEGGNETMVKHNVFDNSDDKSENVLSHSAIKEIIDDAKKKSVGSFQTALKMYNEQNQDSLKHSFDDIEELFPEYNDLRTGAPELVSRDQGWVGVVMSKVHKSPISRIRTRNIDARSDDIRSFGYKKGQRKVAPGNMKLIKRTTDPQTVYITDSMHRDDIIDITDFDVVEYQYRVMRQVLDEEIATAIMIGDGREEGDDHKISEDHIRSIWNDDDLYTIHYDVDIAAAREEIQGTETDAHFGENYVYSEAIVTASLYAREKFKGTGTPDFFCTPHLVNVMLLARDMNGRRIYNSKTDLAAALNVREIYTAEQFAGLVRKDEDGVKHNLLGLFVNLDDYTVGHTKGGEISKFKDFDIDFNLEKYLIETRLSGALTRLYSAIALEEVAGGSNP